MNHDLRFARVTKPDLRRRRLGGLAAILALVALIGGLTLTSSDASGETDEAQPVCSGTPHDSAVCTYY